VVVQKFALLIGVLQDLYSRLCSDILAVRVIDISDVSSMTGSKNDKVGVYLCALKMIHAGECERS
jgi:hypothetical protein